MSSFLLHFEPDHLTPGQRYRSKEGEGRQGSRRSPPLPTPGWGRKRGPGLEPELGMELELALELKLGMELGVELELDEVSRW